MRRRPSSAPPCCSTRRSARPSGRASSTSRRCAASAAAWSTSSIPTSALGRVWDIEFDDTGEPAGNDAGLTTVDHISQSMQYEEMLTWLLFYTSLLDLRKVAAAGRGRSRRPGAQPGGRGARRRPAHRAQRLAEPAHAVLALPHRAVRLGRAAHRLRHRRPSGDRGAAREERRAPARHPGELLRRPRGQDRPAGRPAGAC